VQAVARIVAVEDDLASIESPTPPRPSQLLLGNRPEDV
jgi:hypothetical protein